MKENNNTPINHFRKGETMRKATVAVIALATFATVNTTVWGAYQSNATATVKSANASYHFTQSLSMKTSSLDIPIANSSKIDTHMCKNTEWGAAAMLSGSVYGAGIGKVNNSSTYTSATYELTASSNPSTTGNKSGIFGMAPIKGYGEVMAAGNKAAFSQPMRSAKSRYIDAYAQKTPSADVPNGYFIGDATVETVRFGGISSTVSNSVPVILRYAMFYSSCGSNSLSNYARACVWVGTGL